jgi:membrane associated rhomboid family serine protease
MTAAPPDSDILDNKKTNSPQVETLPAALSKAWVTLAAIAASVVIFIGLTIENDYQSWGTLNRWGYLSAEDVWRGGYWGLVTSAFVHFAIWHLALNVYWLAVLGARMERVIGSPAYLAFFIGAAFVSSACQMGLGDDTGIGASGVVYAIFGFMWIGCPQFPAFRQVLDRQTVQLFMAWLFVCIIVTYLKVLAVGNVAHFTGFLFGVLVAACFVTRYQPRLAVTGLIVLSISAIVSLLWAPWSPRWLAIKAYHAHVAQEYPKALDYYTRIIAIDPDNAWAYINRSFTHQALGDMDKAAADRAKALELDPAIEQKKT